LLLQPEFTYLDVLSTESSVDDLGTCRGVVLRRAVTILRSIETQPLTGRFVRSVGQSSLAVVSFFYWLEKIYREHTFKLKFNFVLAVNLFAGKSCIRYHS
jgi:hypothetical protein